MDQKSEILSAEAARQFLGVSRTTMHRLLSAGELKGLKAGGQWRFRREDLTAYMERRPAGLAVGAISLLDDETRFWEELMDKEGLILEAGASATADDKIAAIADGIIDLATTQGISDIHFEPGRENSMIRFRADGVLREIREMPSPLFEGVVAYIKGVAGMNVEDKIQPQDGRIRRDVGDKWLDVRSSTLPTLTGEALTLRLLRESALPTLDMFSTRPEELQPLRDLMALPNGLVLISGPTGSGKTSTLYAMLLEMIKPEIKIVSVEDPVEVRIPGVQQCNVNRRAGLTYATLVRAALRSDPDVIFCGEINDRETAEVVVNAALSGHLVLGTTTSATAAESVVALLEMGVEPSQLAASLKGAVGQRLVRRLCRECSTDTTPAGSEIQYLRDYTGLEADSILQSGSWKAPVGCEHCRLTGYRGRIPLMEIMTVDDAIREAVSTRVRVPQLQNLSLDQGMISLASDGIRKAARGETSLAEVLRVAGH